MMKNKKYIFCNGLAFSDNEDMEMLRIYAKHGWVFREFKFMCYVLHREEPQDLIFSYDLQKVKKQELEDYVRIFEEAGWKFIPYKDQTIHFFVAPSRTLALHTDQKLKDRQFMPTLIFSSLIVLLGILLFVIAIITKVSGQLGSNLYSIGGALVGGGVVSLIGSAARIKGRRIKLDFQPIVSNLIIFLIGFLCVAYLIYACTSAFDEVGFLWAIIMTFLSLWLCFVGIRGVVNAVQLRRWKKAEVLL